MAIKTYIQQLEEVQSAISKILTKGQAWSAAGDHLTRADLDVLYKQEQRLMPLATREQSSSGGASGPVFRSVLIND